MNEKPVEKIIGWVYCMIDNENMAAVDIYEGNYIKLMKGGALTHTAARKQDYDRAVALYEECVKNDEMISTAYEQNQKLGLGIRIPEITADPKAAEREWEIRKNPQIVRYEEPKKKRIFALKKKKEEKKALRCSLCGGLNQEGQKFCGFCGGALKDEQEKETGSEIREEPGKEYQPEEEMGSARDSYETFPNEGGKGREGKPSPRIMPEEMRPLSVNHSYERQRMPVRKLKGRGAGKGSLKGVLIFSLAVFLVAALFLGAYLLFGQPKEILFDSGTPHDGKPAVSSEGYVAVKAARDIPANTLITEEDIEGIILSAEQFSKYSQTGTYIDETGQIRQEILLMWDDRDTIIGQYTSRELSGGSLLYDTSVTPLHVVSDKTYVEVDVDGEGKSYQTSGEVMPGNTRIQIVALIQTDLGEPKQVLLSEMTLKDRALESIFDAAGQDILNMLSGEESGEGEEVVEGEAGNLEEDGDIDKEEAEAEE